MRKMLKINDELSNKKMIIAEIKRVNNIFLENSRMTIQMFKIHSTLKIYTIKKYFYTWENALNQAEINYLPNSIRYDDKTVTTEIRRVYFEHFKKGQMTIKMFSRHSNLNFNYIKKYFKTWTNALKNAGIETPKDMMIAELTRVYFAYYKNNRMTLENFQSHSKISYNMLSRYFGSWENA